MDHLTEIFEGNKRKFGEEVSPPHKFRKVETVDIKVEGQVLVASKQVLINSSPVFAAMLAHKDFKEAKEKVIELPGKEERDVVMMLAFLSPKAGCESVLINPRPMLKYADEYQIATLADECERLLLAEIKTTRADLEHVYLGDKYRLPVLLHQSLDMCSQVMPPALIQRSYNSFRFYHREEHSELSKVAEPTREKMESIVASFIKSEHIIMIYSKGRVLVPEVRDVKRNFDQCAAEAVNLCELIGKFLPVCNCVPHSTSILGEESAIVEDFRSNLACSECENSISLHDLDGDQTYPVNHSVRYYLGKLSKLLQKTLLDNK